MLKKGIPDCCDALLIQRTKIDAGGVVSIATVTEAKGAAVGGDGPTNGLVVLLLTNGHGCAELCTVVTGLSCANNRCPLDAALCSRPLCSRCRFSSGTELYGRHRDWGPVVSRLIMDALIKSGVMMDNCDSWASWVPL